MASTTRRANRYPTLADSADVPRDIQRLAEDLDDAPRDDQGLLADRPVSTPGTPGEFGRWFKTTDGGLLYRDHGTGYDEILTDVHAAKAGITTQGVIRRGKSIIATEESRTNTAYGTLATPDQVANVVLPTDGLICVAYQAMFKESVNAAARAAIHIGSNQLKVAGTGTASPLVQEAQCQMSADTYGPLTTGPLGLSGDLGILGPGYTGDVTTGQVVGALASSNSGGPCYIFAAAGTYNVSVQFKASSGSVTAKERKLWVWTLGF